MINQAFQDAQPQLALEDAQPQLAIEDRKPSQSSLEKEIDEMMAAEELSPVTAPAPEENPWEGMAGLFLGGGR